MKFFQALLLSGIAVTAPRMGWAEQVDCHYTYGGETRVLTALRMASPYGVGTIAVGSYFRLRVVFQASPADLAAIRIYTYADGDDGPVPIHQATYPYPPSLSPAAPYGFTGLQRVYEPMRDGELQYWCTLSGKAVSP